MLNQIVLQGRLTGDPELKTTPNGTNVCSFTIAVDRDFQSGEKQTDFIPCTAWRQTGEFISKYFHKGGLILVTGSLQSRKWQDKNGNSRVSWDVIVERAHFCGAKEKTADNTYGAAKGVNVVFDEDPDGADDDIPF
jgi:single-strand DNA-binding protein